MNNLEQIKKYLELAEKATPGPWNSFGAIPDWYVNSKRKTICDGRAGSFRNSEFIAASRTMGPALAKALIIAIKTMKELKKRGNETIDAHKINNAQSFVFVSEALADIEKILEDKTN